MRNLVPYNNKKQLAKITPVEVVEVEIIDPFEQAKKDLRNKYKNNYFGGPIRKSLLVILITWLIFGVFMYHKRSAQAENEPIVTDVVIENLSGF